MRSLVAARDTCVVMPTGGGKSLCYQLPALVLGQTAVVISPLIALMQDQAAQLAQMGIPAAVLNSSLSNEQQSLVMRKARDGEYRLLYLSPERLARADTIGWLQRVPIAFFAIDEAHCISEWGHEFRPEYRQLSSLRVHFPDRPIAAFTASATRRVRHDILNQLQLRDPAKYIASFHRANLRYIVKECESRVAVAPASEHSAKPFRRQRNCVRSDHHPGRTDCGFPGGARYSRHRLSRKDGRGPAPAQSGKLDGGRSARAGGNDCVRIRH